MKNQSNIHCLGERAEKYGRLLLEKNDEEKLRRHKVKTGSTC
jgi:hypothetical protein